MDAPQKPPIPQATQAKWQRIVDLLARILNVPAGLIMEVAAPHLKVCVSSSNQNNPYETGELADLDTGLYCETVMADQSGLLVPNALDDPHWEDNPDVEKNMLFYLGLPLLWPDGEVFGTICVLDADNNESAVHYRDLLEEFKGIIDGDLRYLIDITEREQMEKALQQAHDKLELRVEERTQELSETNTALKILLQKREHDKTELEDHVLANINERVMPYLGKLKKVAENDRQLAYLNILESNLTDIASPFSNYLSAKCATLTPTETEVTNLIKQGRKTKEIAELMNLSTTTIDFHRNNIRKKLGIQNHKTNLRSYLTTIA